MLVASQPFGVRLYCRNEWIGINFQHFAVKHDVPAELAQLFDIGGDVGLMHFGAHLTLAFFVPRLCRRPVFGLRHPENLTRFC